MQYKLIYEGNQTFIKGRVNENDEYGLYAAIGEDSRLTFYGDLSEKRCKEIEEFLTSQCIHIDEKGFAYQLVN